MAGAHEPAKAALATIGRRACRPPASPLKSWGGDAAQAQHQGHGMHRRGLKAIMLVEAFCALMDRMDKNGPHASVRGDPDRPVDGVLQQGWPELGSLRPLIDRKSGQHDHWHGVGHVAADI